MMRSGLLAVCLGATLCLPGLAGAAGTPAGSWLDGAVEVAFLSMGQAEVRGSFDIHQVALDQRIATAQDLRAEYQQALAYGQGAVYTELLQGTLAAEMQTRLAALFPSAEVHVQGVLLDPASLQAQASPDPWHPPVRFTFGADVAFDLARLLPDSAVPVNESTLRTALDIGARARMPYEVTAPAGYNATFTLTLPPGLRALAAPGAELAQDGGSLRVRIVNWQGALPLAHALDVTLASRRAPSRLATQAAAELDVDMSRVEGLTLPGLLRGDYGVVAARVDATVLAHALDLDDVPALQAQIRERLPAGVTLDGLNADGLRLAVQQGLVTPRSLDQVQAAFRTLAAQRLAGLTDEPLQLRGGFAPGTLDAKLVSDPLDGDPPVAYAVHGELRIPLSATAQRLGGATVAAAEVGPVLLQRDLTFRIPRVPGMDTTYRITLPAGIALSDLQLTHAHATRSEDAGREVVVLAPDGDDAEATFTVAVTGAFLLAQFWYAIAGAVALVLAIVAGVAWLRRRRRARPTPAVREPVVAESVAEPAAK